MRAICFAAAHELPKTIRSTLTSFVIDLMVGAFQAVLSHVSFGERSWRGAPVGVVNAPTCHNRDRGCGAGERRSRRAAQP